MAATMYYQVEKLLEIMTKRRKKKRVWIRRRYVKRLTLTNVPIKNSRKSALVPARRLCRIKQNKNEQRLTKSVSWLKNRIHFLCFLNDDNMLSNLSMICIIFI